MVVRTGRNISMEEIIKGYSDRHAEGRVNVRLLNEEVVTINHVSR